MRQDSKQAPLAGEDADADADYCTVAEQVARRWNSPHWTADTRTVPNAVLRRLPGDHPAREGAERDLPPSPE